MPQSTSFIIILTATRFLPRRQEKSKQKAQNIHRLLRRNILRFKGLRGMAEKLFGRGEQNIAFIRPTKTEHDARAFLKQVFVNRIGAHHGDFVFECFAAMAERIGLKLQRSIVGTEREITHISPPAAYQMIGKIKAQPQADEREQVFPHQISML